MLPGALACSPPDDYAAVYVRVHVCGFIMIEIVLLYLLDRSSCM
jgi:hypothetical protein